jgi:hypothetical protein
MSWNALCQAQYGRDCFDPPNNPATVDEGWRLNALLARIALDNRITIANPQYQPLTAQYLPLFQKHTLPLLNGTADTRLSGAKLTSFQADINKNAPPGAPLAAWRAQASQEGFLDRAFVYIAPECDEIAIADLPKWDKCWNNYLMKVRTGTEWPDVPILVTTTIQSETNYLNNHSGIKPFINRMVVLVTNMDGRTNPDGTPFLRFNGNQRPLYEPFRTRAQGNELWLYTSCESHGCGSTDLCQRSPTEKPTDDPGYNGWPSYAIDQPASEARAMGWMCFLYRATGELYFTTTHCLSSKTQTGEPQTAWTAQYAYGGNGDGTLFYPWDKERVGGKTWIPIESMRLKLIRDGYEDYEYLKKVVALNQEPQAFDIGKELFPPGNPARGDGMMYNTSRSSENESDSAIQTARRKLAHIIDPVNVP